MCTVRESQYVPGLRRLGLDPAHLTRVELVHEKHGSALYRIWYRDQSLVLKWLRDPAGAVEVRAYALLAAHGVPTLPLHASTEDMLLLEDLSRSAMWRLANAQDVEQAETGLAVAGWYRALHAAGREMLASPEGPPGFLQRETDVLDPSGLVALGEKLGLAGDPIWQSAAEHIEDLKRALRSLPETINYNDFHWTNLALSRERPLRAIVFDYHLLGIGPAACDCRNVTGSLGEPARAAFREAYGPVDERAAILDAPVSVLYSLHVAAQLPSFPAWAGGCLRHVRDGGLDADLRRALQVL